ncbi:MAG: hypothetical protein U0744_02820 [Gemmataceae bacterium]
MIQLKRRMGGCDAVEGKSRRVPFAFAPIGDHPEKSAKGQFQEGLDGTLHRAADIEAA